MNDILHIYNKVLSILDHDVFGRNSHLIAVLPNNFCWGDVMPLNHLQQKKAVHNIVERLSLNPDNA